MQIDTFCVKERPDNRTTKPHILPIYATSSFVFDSAEEGIEIFSNIESGHTYSRYANPTVDVVAQKIADLETHGLGFEATPVMTSSGMSAISTLLLGLLKPGDIILSQGNLYGGTTELITHTFGEMGVKAILINFNDLDQVETALREAGGKVKLLYCETPANPTLACVNIEALAALAHQYGALCAIDNTFATPYLQQPFAFGVDFIVHSTTKYLNGHGNSMAGIIIGRDRELTRKKVWRTMKLAGTNCSPFEAWLTYNGLKTLALRMDRHSSNALALATFLATHPAVLQVNYPGLPSHPNHALAKKQMRAFGGMLSFELKGGIEAGIRFMNKVKLCTNAPTLGDADTLVLHPASSSHLHVAKATRESFGITDGLVRVSVGIENTDDLIDDVEQAILPL